MPISWNNGPADSIQIVPKLQCACLSNICCCRTISDRTQSIFHQCSPGGNCNLTPEQQGLLQKAQSSLRAAKLLTSDGLHDFALSRAYYTMSYIVKAFLLCQGLAFSSHSDLISAFDEHFVRTGIAPPEFHNTLLHAQDQRIRGDYAIESGLTEVDASRQIVHAEEFLKLAERLMGSAS